MIHQRQRPRQQLLRPRRRPLTREWRSADGSVVLCRGPWQQGLADVAAADALITDPPYGTTDCPWDQRPDIAELGAAATRWLRPGGLRILFAAEPLATELISAWRKDFSYDLVWHKTRPVGFLNAGRMPLRAHERLLVFAARGGKRTYNPQTIPCKPYVSKVSSHQTPIYRGSRPCVRRRDSKHPTSVLQHGVASCERGLHPCQKPLSLVEWLVRSYTNPGDLVVDPYAGSATTAVVCLRLGRRFVGCERDPGYFRQASRRLAAEERESAR